MESPDGTTLKIPSVQKLNEGSYQCVISNCAGSQISESAKLSIGKNARTNQIALHEAFQQHSVNCFLFVADPPRVTIHPIGLKDAIPGQPITFTIHVTGTEHLVYQWWWKPAGDEHGGREEWQPCDMKFSDGTTLTIPSVQKLNEGSYQCVISNCAGSQISTAANLSIGMNQIDSSHNCTSMKHLSSILLSISTYS